MKLKPVVVLGAVGLATAAVLARNRDYTVSMHPDDWLGRQEGDTHRRYRSWRHAHHHLKELRRLQVPMAQVYLRRAISPAFREQIMIVTAICDNCPG